MRFEVAESLEINDTLTLISPRVSSAGAIAQKIGIEVGENNPPAVILEITNNLAGVLSSDAVNWLNNARRA